MIKKVYQSMSIHEVKYDRITGKEQETLRNLKENKKGFDQWAFLPLLQGKRDQKNDIIFNITVLSRITLSWV